MDTTRNTITIGTDRELENGVLSFLKRYELLAGNNYDPDNAFHLLAKDPEMQERVPELVAHLVQELEKESPENLFSRFVGWHKFSYITKNILVTPFDVKKLFSLQAFEQKVYTQ